MYGGRRKEAGEKKVTTHGKTAPEMLAESMLSSFQTLIVIGGYVVIFMILTDVLKAVLQYISGESGFIGEVVTGCLEMTSGCSGVAGSDAPLLWKIADLHISDIFRGAFRGGPVCKRIEKFRRSAVVFSSVQIDPGVDFCGMCRYNNENIIGFREKYSHGI